MSYIWSSLFVKYTLMNNKINCFIQYHAMASDDDILLSVAIDFGTTYSGYAFSTRGDFKTDPTKIYANEDWPAGNKGFSKKTPTVLLLDPDKKFEAFGYEAEEMYNQLAADKEHKDWFYFRRFKMKLHGEKVKCMRENCLIFKINFRLQSKDEGQIASL